MSECWLKDINKLRDIYLKKINYHREICELMFDDSFIDLPDEVYEYIIALDSQLENEIYQLDNTIRAVDAIYVGFFQNESRELVQEIFPRV